MANAPLKKPLNDALQKLMSKRPKPDSPANDTLAESSEGPMQLQLWPDAVRGVPNIALRGALFSISQERAIAKNLELIAAVDGVEVRFKGERFNQTDLDVWEMLLHLARQRPLGDRVEFSAHSFLQSLQRSQGGTDHDQLREEIARLRSGTLDITWTSKEKVYGGGLVEKYFYDQETKRYVVVFDKRLLNLYEAGYSYIDWEQRKLLGSNSLAKWLHGFYSSHAKPYHYKVETIKKLCGSSTGRLGDFRKQLRRALDLLKKHNVFTSWEINEEDHLIVTKIPSLSQQRHLQKARGASSKALA